jgi:hypothetical protein
MLAQWNKRSSVNRAPHALLRRPGPGVPVIRASSAALIMQVTDLAADREAMALDAEPSSVSDIARGSAWPI